MSLKMFLVAAVIATAALGAGSASASPTTDGCPSHYELRAVESFGSPYILPQLTDAAGNHDGYVCVFPMPDAARDADCRSGGLIACQLEAMNLPLYQFTDDVRPAADHARVTS